MGKRSKRPLYISQLNCEVLLQTLRCVIRHGDKHKEVRVLLDPGSQRSYILDSTAVQLGLQPRGETKLCHLLFGGAQEVQLHKLYGAEIESNGYHSQLKLLGHQRLCGGIPKMAKGPWMAELKEKRIFVNDLGEDRGEVEVLIGSDYYAHWLTGKKCSLQNGLVALETHFGWTLSGRLKEATNENESSAVSMTVTSMCLSFGS